MRRAMSLRVVGMVVVGGVGSILGSVMGGVLFTLLILRRYLQDMMAAAITLFFFPFGRKLQAITNTGIIHVKIKEMTEFKFHTFILILPSHLWMSQ